MTRVIRNLTVMATIFLGEAQECQDARVIQQLRCLVSGFYDGGIGFARQELSREQACKLVLLRHQDSIKGTTF